MNIRLNEAGTIIAYIALDIENYYYYLDKGLTNSYFIVSLGDQKYLIFSKNQITLADFDCTNTFHFLWNIPEG